MSFWPFGPSFPFILSFWAFIFFHFGLLGLHFVLLGLDFELLGLGPGFCPGALLAWAGSIPSGFLSLGAPRTTKVGIYGPALNPKRWKFGWLACHTAEWEERRKVDPALGATTPRVTPSYHQQLRYAATPTPFRCVGGAIHA